MKIVLEIELLLCIIIITLPCIKKLHPNVQVTLIDYYYYLPLSIFLVLLLPTFLHCTMYFGARSEVKWLLINLSAIVENGKQLANSRKGFTIRESLGKLSLIYLLGKDLEVAGKVFSITFQIWESF